MHKVQIELEIFLPAPRTMAELNYPSLEDYDGYEITQVEAETGLGECIPPPLRKIIGLLSSSLSFNVDVCSIFIVFGEVVRSSFTVVLHSHCVAFDAFSIAVHARSRIQLVAG